LALLRSTRAPAAAFEKDVTLATGANHNLALPTDGELIRIQGPSGAYSLSGMVAPAVSREVTLFNYTVQVLTIEHQDAGSTAANRFICPGSADVTVPIFGCVRAIYSPLTAAWVVLA
jgi:hypothetical protein